MTIATTLATLALASAPLETAVTARNNVVRKTPNLGRCINVAGALEADNEGDWGYRVRDEDLQRIYDTGFSTIRLPVKWSAHALAEPPYTIDPVFLARVDHVIKAAMSSGLKVIVDMHHYDELYEDPERHEARFVNMWVQLARHYKHYPNDKLIFELVNEPRDNFSGARMSNVQNRLLTMVRESNPTRTVILTGDLWGLFQGLKNLYVPPDPNIMVSVHYYEPFNFTHQGASWMPEPPPVGAVWGRPSDIRTLGAYAESMAKWQEQHNVRIFFGEFGVTQNVSTPERANWTAGVRAAMEAVDIPWCYFDFATGFSAFDQRRGAWTPLLLNALIPKRSAQEEGS